MPETAADNLSHSRRLAREIVFQALYMQHVGAADRESAIKTALDRHPMADDASDFVRMVVSGVESTVDSLDEAVEPFLAKGWTLARIAVSDLIVLRLAAYELFYQPDIPPKVTISQAVDLAKRFGTADSGAFVNGVLGNLLQASPKSEWEPPILDETVGDEPSTVIDLTGSEPHAQKVEAEAEDEDVTVGSWVIKREDAPPEP